MLLTEYFGERALESLEHQLQKYLNGKNLQKLLWECFKNVKEVMTANGEDVSGFSTEKSQIMNIKSELIKPSLTDKKLLNNLRNLFDNLLNMDSNGVKVQNQICEMYLKRAQKEMLELYHVYEKVEDLEENIIKLQKDNSLHHNQLVDEFLKLQSEIRESNKLYFIDGLDNSRVIPYLDLLLSEEVDDDIQYVIEEETGVYFEYMVYNRNGFKHSIISFLVSLKQGELRDFLEVLDGVLVEEGIRVYNISI